MADFVIGADKVTRWVVGISSGVIVSLLVAIWADTRMHSDSQHREALEAAKSAAEAAAAAAAALGSIRDIVQGHEYRIHSLEDRVSLLEGRNPLQGPPGPIRFKGRSGDRRDVPRPPHDPPTLPDPPAEPKRPRDKAEPPDDPVIDVDKPRAGRMPAEE